MSRSELSPEERKERRREANRAYHREGRRKFTPEQKERHAAYMKNYKKVNKDRDAAHIKQYKKEYRLKNKVIIDADRAKRAKEHPHREVRYRFATRLRRDYGLTVEQWEEKLESQGGLCSLCSKPHGDRQHTKLCIDHCHITGKVRELICRSCNMVLGGAKDSPELLRKMADYLEVHRDKNAPSV